MKGKVLIIDDDPDVAEVLSAYIEALGYEFRIARRGREGLEALHTETFFAVFTDYLMPDIKGDRILAEISMEHPEMRGRLFLVTGASVNTELEAQIRSYGAEILRKPFTKDCSSLPLHERWVESVNRLANSVTKKARRFGGENAMRSSIQ